MIFTLFLLASLRVCLFTLRLSINTKHLHLFIIIFSRITDIIGNAHPLMFLSILKGSPKPFIRNLPFGKLSSIFVSENISKSRILLMPFTTDSKLFFIEFILRWAKMSLFKLLLRMYFKWHSLKSGPEIRDPGLWCLVLWSPGTQNSESRTLKIELVIRIPSIPTCSRD